MIKIMLSLSSMKEKSLFFFSLDDKNKIQKLDKVYIGERIRDLFFYDKKNLFIFRGHHIHWNFKIKLV